MRKFLHILALFAFLFLSLLDVIDWDSQGRAANCFVNHQIGCIDGVRGDPKWDIWFWCMYVMISILLWDIFVSKHVGSFDCSINLKLILEYFASFELVKPGQSVDFRVYTRWTVSSFLLCSITNSRIKQVGTFISYHECSIHQEIGCTDMHQSQQASSIHQCLFSSCKIPQRSLFGTIKSH